MNTVFKKLISLMLSVIISFCAISYCAGSIYSVKAEEDSINGFVEDGVKLIRENDVGKEFIPEAIEVEPINEDAETLSAQRTIAKSSILYNETNDIEEFSDTAFQTCRLIVKASRAPDKLNSIGIASGFKDWYIVQFKTEEDTQAAYEEYFSEEYVLSVSPDLVVKCYFDEKRDGEPIQFDMDEIPSRLNSWGSIMTGLYDVKDYINSHPEFNREITIGVVDDGIDIDN
ncbi:MAG: hypothetical protein IK085_10280, partial [Clostridia bacterium]|nr:hypothetical protein [Clostridia bacterium]